jgi:hypothetical protein
MHLNEEDDRRKQVELLDQIISLCDHHGLTHYECVVARQRLAEFGEEIEMLRQRKKSMDTK